MGKIYKTKYYGGSEQAFESIEDLFDVVFDPEQYEDSSSTDEQLDNEYGSIEINGETYWASAILSSMDENMYNDFMHENAENYANELREEHEDEIRDLAEGECVRFNGYEITCEDSEEEETEEEKDEDNTEDFYSIMKLIQAIPLPESEQL